MWIKRVAITQENSWRDGRVESRLTHISVDARLVGRAELVIEERPLKPADSLQLAACDNEGEQR
jgi:hypothetical protein